MSGVFLGIISGDISMTNWLNVVTFQFFFIKFRNILQIPLNGSVFFLQSWIWTSYSSNSTSLSVTSSRLSPFLGANYINHFRNTRGVITHLLYDHSFSLFFFCRREIDDMREWLRWAKAAYKRDSFTLATTMNVLHISYLTSNLVLPLQYLLKSIAIKN